MKNFKLHALVIGFAALTTFAAASSVDAFIVFFDGSPSSAARIANRIQAVEPIAINIDVDAWMAAAKQGGAGTGGGAGKASFSDLNVMRQHNPLTVTKAYDKASPKLWEACATGKHIPKAKLYVRKAGGNQEEYYVFELENTMVSGYSISSGGDRPMESISFNFTKIEFKAATQEEKDRMKGWDVKSNKSGL